MSSAVSFIRQAAPSAAESGYGFYPKFTSVKPAKADNLAALIRKTDAGDLDYDALNVFFRIGTFIGTDTPYRHIKADPPDYSWARHTPVVQQTRSQIIDSYIDLFRQALRRCNTRGEAVSLGLSGGRDSRHILLELCASNRKPSRCWTVDLPSKPAEARVAKQICDRFGITHSVFHLSGRYADVEAAKNRITSFSSLQHAWLTEAILEGLADTPVLFDGIGGDVLSAGLFLTDKRVKLLSENRIDELVEEIVGHYKLPVIREISLFPRERALEKVNTEFRKHLGAPDPISSFYFWNRTRRDIGCSAFALLRQRGQTVFAPYLDPDLSRFLAGLSPSVTVDHQLHTEVIAKAYPQHSDIPYAEKSEQPAAHYRKVAADVLRYVLTNASPMIQRSKVCFQLLRSMVSPNHSADVLYLGPYTVYLTELWKDVNPAASAQHV